jgi:hypothetical protein
MVALARTWILLLGMPGLIVLFGSSIGEVMQFVVDLKKEVLL